MGDEEEPFFGDDGGYDGSNVGYGETTYEDAEGGPCQKMGNGFVLMCCGCLAFPTFLFLLGYNERRNVCDQQKYGYLEKEGKEFPCGATSAHDIGEIGYFSCPIDANTYTTFSPKAFNSLASGGATDAFSDSLSFRGPAATQEVWVYQCMESYREETYTHGNVKETRKIYEYSLQWLKEIKQTSGYRNQFVDRQRNGCNGWTQYDGTPSWPTNLARNLDSEVLPGNPIMSGGITIDQELMKSISTPDVPAISQTASFRTGGSDWPRSMSARQVKPSDLLPTGDGVYETCASHVGCVRIKYSTNNGQIATVLGKLGVGKVTEKADIPSFWGCNADKYSEIWLGDTVVTKAATHELLNTRVSVTTWLLRVLGIFGAWFGIYCCFGPLTAAIDVMGDCLDMIPCCGDFLESVFEGVANWVICIMSCGIGCGCAFCVIAIVWVAMRPMVGIPLFIAATCFCCIAIGIRVMTKSKKQQMEDPDDE